MVRLFGHHIALPVAVLILCEFCLFLFGLSVAVWIYPAFARSIFNLDQLTVFVTAVLAAINLACLIAAGLYTRDACRVGSKLSAHLATATSLIVFAFAAYLMVYASIYGYRFSSLYALALLAVCIQFLLLFFLRAIFFNIFDIAGFKRCIVLLGEGPFVGKARAWLTEHERGYTHVIHYDTHHDSVWQERAVPVRGRLVRSAALATAPDLSLSNSNALPEFVHHHGVDEIVVAAIGAHAGSVWDLLDCRTRGVKVIDFLTFWERETGRIDLDAIEPSWLVYSGGFRSNKLRQILQRSLDVSGRHLGFDCNEPLDGHHGTPDQAG